MRHSIPALLLLASGLVGCFRPLPPPSPAERKRIHNWKNPARPSPDGTVRFFVLGDHGCGCEGQRAVADGLPALVEREGYTFGITVGDNFLPSGVASVSDPQWEHAYEAMYGTLGLPIMATLGNHDWDQPADAQWRYRGRSRTWNMPAPYYHYSVGNVLLVALDTTRWDSSQARWLRRVLSRSKARWKIVYGHHPVYSYGAHGTSYELYHSLRPLLLARADFYIAGHDHDKQLIQYGPRPVWVISGAGSRTRPVGRGPGSLFASSTIGVVGLIIDGNQTIVRFFDERGTLEFQRIYRRIYLKPGQKAPPPPEPAPVEQGPKPAPKPKTKPTPESQPAHPDKPSVGPEPWPPPSSKEPPKNKPKKKPAAPAPEEAIPEEALPEAQEPAPA